MSCDATVSRVLLDAESVPLDLGRATRLFSADQRRMMSLRDGGCRFPGCGLPPAFTDAHHIVAWQAGGQPDVKNGVLMCRIHHRELHEGAWRIHCEKPGHPNADGALLFVKELGEGIGRQQVSRPRCLKPIQLTQINWWNRPPPHDPE